MAYLGKQPARVPVDANDIPNDSITSSKILNNAVTAAKVAADVATQTELDSTAATKLSLTGGQMTGNITSNGKIGIGTTAPLRQLHISDTSANAEIAFTSGTSGAASVLFGDGLTGTDVYKGYIQYQHNGDYMSLATAATEHMRISSDGFILANKMATSYATLKGPATNSNITGTSNFAIMQVVENPDSLYNSGNGRFTCPVDGLYFMSAMSINTAALNQTIQALPLKNGTEILGVGRMYENQNHNHGGSGTSGYTRCSQGDYLQWDWYGSIYADAHSSASFALIHGET